jgi:hypothetical protein
VCERKKEGIGSGEGKRIGLFKSEEKRKSEREYQW